MADKFGGVPVEKDAFGGQSIKSSITEDPSDASGAYTAFLSGLTNDETNKVFWIAKRRFPEIDDPSLFYGFDKDGDLFYRDPYTGESKKEFRDGLLGNDVDYLDNIGPAGQFLAEVTGGVLGMGTGFVGGGLPGAAVGGAWGTAKAGAGAYGVRAGLSYVLGGPPLAVETAAKDLAISSAFGAIPFGAPTRAAAATAPKGLRWILEKFPGSDGRSALADIVQNGGKTVDDKLAYMAEKYPDIKISRAEAGGLVGNAGYKTEVWISKHARNQKMIDHYESRNQRVTYHAENFFDHLLSGKYTPKHLKDRLTGKPAGDAEFDVVRATEDYIKAEKRKLAQQVKPKYEEAYAYDAKIDVSALVKELDAKLLDKNIKGKYRKSLKEIRESFVDQNTGKLKDTTELLHNTLKHDFRPLIEGLTKDNQRFIKGEVSNIRRALSDKIKAENPLYEQVTKLYDDALGTSQALDRSIVGQFAKIAGKGGEPAMRLTKKLFSGNIRPHEIKELKAVLQSTDEGAQAWQNLKGTWLATQWDDAVVSQLNPLSEPHAFLRALGIKAPSKAFTRTGDALMDASPAELSRLSGELGEITAKGKKAKMWEAMLEPEELTQFIDLTNLMHMVGRIQTQAGSDTFGNLTMDMVLSQEAKQVLGSSEAGKQMGRKALGFFEAVGNTSSRIFGKGFGDLLTGVRNRQKEAYTDLLISHIVDPAKAVASQAMLESTKPLVYLISQTFVKGGAEGLDNLFTSIQERTDDLREASEERERENLQQPPPQGLENLQGSLQDFQVPQIDQPLFEPEADLMPQELLSPTILPDERDREIAMRQQLGITGLV